MILDGIKRVLTGRPKLQPLLGLDPDDAGRVAEEAARLRAEWAARGRTVRIRIGSPWVDLMTEEQEAEWRAAVGRQGVPRKERGRPEGGPLSI